MIDSLKGEHFFLSNFYPAMIVGPSGLFYSTLEHAYQAAKSADRKDHVVVQSLRSPGQAKRFGKGIALVENWNEIRVGVMYELLQRKFSKSELRERLLATADEEIIEGNYWNDRFWGVDDKTKLGKNQLGKLLMRVRSEIRCGHIGHV